MNEKRGEHGENLPYEAIPGYPSQICATAILARLIDGLAFRFRWATHGLTPGHQAFRASEHTLSILELVQHVWGLVNWVDRSLTGKSEARPDDFEGLRRAVLERLFSLRQDVLQLDDASLRECVIDDHPFWHVINGPLADALTHVGQINAFRRLAGNPAPKANVFSGKPPVIG